MRKVAPLPEKVEFPIEGLRARIKCRAKAYLVVGLESASSYGLKLASCCRISAAGIEAVTRAIEMLSKNTLPSRADLTRAGGIQTSFDVGKRTLFLFWTRDRESTGLELLNARRDALGGPDQFQKLLLSLEEKTANALSIAAEQQDQFRVLALSGNSDSDSARLFVRDYLEGPLPRLQQKVLKWFADLRIADPAKEYQGQARNNFSIANLAAATVPRKSDNKPAWDKIAPDFVAQLMRAALTGGPLPDSLLTVCVRRIRVEGKEGFRPARMALMKLILLRKGVPMSETLNRDEHHQAYLFGRLLQVFAQIQYAALGNVNANVVDKFYGTFSAAPAMVFGQLMAHAQKHLRKIRSESPRTHDALEKRLADIRRLLTAAPPPLQFTLQEQGRFALGYYHEKAKSFEEIAKRKAHKAARTAATTVADRATQTPTSNNT
jgi:CRISPR-associated protein Csd1